MHMKSPSIAYQNTLTFIHYLMMASKNGRPQVISLNKGTQNKFFSTQNAVKFLKYCHRILGCHEELTGQLNRRKHYWKLETLVSEFRKWFRKSLCNKWLELRLLPFVSLSVWPPCTGTHIQPLLNRVLQQINLGFIYNSFSCPKIG